MWKYEIYEIGSKDRDKGQADLIDLERLLPAYLQTVVAENKTTKPFKLEVIENCKVYKVWR